MLALFTCLAAFSFLAGSVPFGLLLAKRRGVDIRAAGSGNIGATNVARVIGLRLGLIVLVLDAAKGAGAVLAAQEACPDERAVAIAGFAAVCGHCFSPWLRFRGGKGVATALGVFLVVAPVGAAIALGVFAVVAAATRIPAVGSLAATVALAIYCVRSASPPIGGLSVATALLIFIKHRTNLVRLVRPDDKPID